MLREQGGSMSNLTSSTLHVISKKKKKGEFQYQLHREGNFVPLSFEITQRPLGSVTAACYVRVLTQPLSATSLCR